ncbi:ATP-binding cassette domain-containing protein [Cryptosporangium aurantiacum]|uniref:ABC-2 type transport system ATP-binding protein n=1 Tax=Cryptosporangium aurantiacum TaxID=134849 RepID=A0A1M7Q6Q1_9ACTN|nr:ATP-binding cassette domain-containing protein [Cryptosporangium aurantiacum]SHN26190.1 ABC-2 type transport system ATP-binding protein [Cryptosporangium aurantiacum]
METAIRAEGLTKRFGTVQALDGVDLAIPAGTVYALLGPNGAGKSTTIRVLATLLRPDAGRATVAGFDVVDQAEEVRHRIGLAGQYAAVDELLTGAANLRLVGRLSRLTRREARRRADELIERFDLVAVADKLVRTYSGGTRRRLDLAASLLVAPDVLFLDEPTTGLDPRNRAVMWDLIRELVAEGTTVLLSTQYLEEADRLAGRIAVIDQGRVVADGTPAELKATVSGERIDVVVVHPDGIPVAVDVLRRVTDAEPAVEEDTLRISAPAAGVGTLLGVVRELDATGVALADVGLRESTLDEVFCSSPAVPGPRRRCDEHAVGSGRQRHRGHRHAAPPAHDPGAGGGRRRAGDAGRVRGAVRVRVRERGRAAGRR